MDQLVLQRLGEGGFIPFVVAIFAVATKVDEDVDAKFLPEGDGKAGTCNAAFRF